MIPLLSEETLIEVLLKSQFGSSVVQHFGIADELPSWELYLNSPSTIYFTCIFNLAAQQQC